MRNALLLLEKMTAAFPPGPKQRHSLTLTKEGLELTLFLGQQYHPILLEERDLDLPIDELVTEISRIEGLRDRTTAE